MTPILGQPCEISGFSLTAAHPQYKALTAAKWDIIIIMLGTNDAKDAGSHGPHNWPHTCTGPTGLKQGCQLKGSRGFHRTPSRPVEDPSDPLQIGEVP